MTTTDMLNQTIATVESMVGNENLYFKKPFEMKNYWSAYGIWAVGVSPRRTLYVMDEREEWFLVEARERRLVTMLYKKVREIKEQSIKNCSP